MNDYSIFGALPVQINDLCVFAFDCIVKYGLSKGFWLQMFIFITGIVGQVLVARKDIRAFYFWCAGNVAIIISSVPEEQYGTALLYFLSIGFNMYSIMQWRKSQNETAEPTRDVHREVARIETGDRAST